MAKGGKRTYVRDGNGRFASTPGSAAKKAAKSTSGRASTLGARTGLKSSKAKLRAKDKADQTLQNTLSTRAQKGAVKRGSRKLAAAKTAAQARISGGRKGVIGKPKGLKAGALATKGVSSAKAATTSKTASAKTKGERIIDRIIANLKRASRESTSKNQEQKLARTLAVSNFAKSVISRRGVGSRDPNKQYSRQDLLPTLNKSLSKPLPKKERKSTTKSKKDATPALIALAAGAAKKTRDSARKKGLLLPPDKQPRRSTPTPKPPTRAKGSKASLPRTPGTVAKPKGLKPGVGVVRAQIKIFDAKPSKSKTEKQRAKSLLSVNKKAWIKEEIKTIESKSGKRLAPKQRQKEERRISAAINKLAPSDQIRGARRTVQLTKQERQKEARLNTRNAQGARNLKKVDKEIEARFVKRQKAQSKADEFVKNAKTIAADRTKPLNTRKLANAVAKGVRRPSVTGGKLKWIKTERTDPSGWDRVRGEKGILYSMQKLRQAREAREAATDGLKQGRRWVMKGNKKPFAKKKRVPKPIFKGLPRPASTIKGRDLESQYTPYQRLLRKESRKQSRSLSRIEKQKPPASRKKTPMRRPAAPR